MGFIGSPARKWYSVLECLNLPDTHNSVMQVISLLDDTKSRITIIEQKCLNEQQVMDMIERETEPLTEGLKVIGGEVDETKIEICEMKRQLCALEKQLCDVKKVNEHQYNEIACLRKENGCQSNQICELNKELKFNRMLSIGGVTLFLFGTAQLFAHTLIRGLGYTVGIRYRK